MEKKKIYPATQLICVLPPVALKCFMYICGFQGSEFFKLYVHQMARALNLTDDEVSMGIQTLSDNKLLDISRSGETYLATLNGEQVGKYFNIPFDKVIEKDGIKLSTDVTWNKVIETKPSPSPVIEDMSEQDLKRLLLRIEASLSEKQQLKKVVVTAEPNEKDDLPW